MADPLQELKARILRHRALLYLALAFSLVSTLAAGLNQVFDLTGTLRDLSRHKSPMATLTSSPSVPTSPPTLEKTNAFAMSPDGQYEAIRTPDQNHLTVIRVATGEIVLTTHAERFQDNDVKAAKFCSNSDLFAAAYYYSRPHRYTWIGFWSLTEGRFHHGVVADNRGLYSLDEYC